ncbi:MAG TPA: hypothetical protein VIO60_07120, partial [Rectinemataceae bacterium]
FEAVADSLKPSRPGATPALGEVSGPTIPLPVFPRLGYTFIPRGQNRPYGIAALVLAALDYAEAISCSPLLLPERQALYNGLAYSGVPGQGRTCTGISPWNRADPRKSPPT